MKTRETVSCFAVLVMMAIFLIPSPTWCSKSSAAEAQYLRGQTFDQQGKHEAAIGEWRRVLSSYGDQRSVCANALLSIGSTYRFLEQPERAVVELTKVLTVYSDFRPVAAQSLITIAWCLQDQGQFADALKAYGRLIKEYPEMPIRCVNARLGIGECMDGLGQYKDALAAFAGVLAECPENRTECAQALLLAGHLLASDNMKEYDQAVAKFQAVTKDYKDLEDACVKALFGIGKAEERAGRLDKALEAYDKIYYLYHSRHQDCVRAMRSRAEIYLQRGEYEKAIVEYVNNIKHNPKQARGLLIAKTIDSLSDVIPTLSPKVQADLQSTLADFAAFKNEDDAWKAVTVAKEKAEKGDVAGAKTDLEALLDTPIISVSRGRLRQVGFAQLSIGDKDGARSTFARILVLAARTETPEVCAMIGVEYPYYLRDYATVTAQAQAALKAFPQSDYAVEWRYFLAQSYDYTDQKDKALVAYGDVLSRHSKLTDEKARQFLVCSLMRSGVLLTDLKRRAEAAAKYEQVVKDYRDMPQAKTCELMLKSLREDGL